jgi:UPF0271 protein
MPIALNCDVGESNGNWRFGDNAAITLFIGLANIACGFHSGNPSTLQRAVDLAAKIGAPPDRDGFVRREMRLSLRELRAAFAYQFGALAEFADAARQALHYVKPNSIVFGIGARDIATAIAKAAKAFDLPLVGIAGAPHEKVAQPVGIGFVDEFSADLSYSSAGEMIISREPSAVEKAASHLEMAVREDPVNALDGQGRHATTATDGGKEREGLDSEEFIGAGCKRRTGWSCS